ncbi:MAG TPA: hypothetical protein VGF34_17770 [Stellaceae bacterium]|jgi:hypothetical protein
MGFYGFVLGSLAVWRITHLLHAEDGPWDLVVRLRRAAGDGFWAAVLDCLHCLSLWVAAVFALWLGSGVGERVLLWLAWSAAAILLERLTAPAPPPAPYWTEEDADALLRKKEGEP